MWLRRRKSSSAISRGFHNRTKGTGIDVSIQLASLSTPELLYMVHGRRNLSAEDLIESIQWPDVVETIEFEANGSYAPAFLKALITDY